MTVTTEPAMLNDHKYRRYHASWEEDGMQFDVRSSIFSDDQSPIARAYILESFVRQVLNAAERGGPRPG